MSLPLTGELPDLIARVRDEMGYEAAAALEQAVERLLEQREREAAVGALEDAAARIGWDVEANWRSALRLGLEQAIDRLREMRAALDEAAPSDR